MWSAAAFPNPVVSIPVPAHSLIYASQQLLISIMHTHTHTHTHTVFNQNLKKIIIFSY